MQRCSHGVLTGEARTDGSGGEPSLTVLALLITRHNAILVYRGAELKNI